MSPSVANPSPSTSAPPPSSPLTTTTNTTTPSNPRGPLKSRFQLYWNQPSTHTNPSSSSSILVLQFPNRKNFQSYSRQHKQQPLELRIKPNSGLVEMDVPIATRHLYDWKKGVLYGRALRRGVEERKNEIVGEKSGGGSGRGREGGRGAGEGVDEGEEGNGGEEGEGIKRQQPVSYGLAGGFGVNALGRMGGRKGGGGSGGERKRVKTEERDEEGGGGMEVDREESAEGDEGEEGEGERQGWRNAVERGEVMDRMTLGGRIQKVKEGDPIYAVGIFHGDELHLTRAKAICSLQPLPHHRDALAEMEKAAARVQLEAEGQAPRSVIRAVNMTAKSTEDDDEADSTEIAKTLKAIQEEPWQQLEWIDQDDQRAWHAFSAGLFAQDSNDVLVSALSSQQYLDAISAPKVDPAALGRKVLRSKRLTPEAEDSFDESTDEEEEEGEEVMAEEGMRREAEDVN